MTREEQIEDLKRQYVVAIGERRWARANLIYARLSSLRLRQLNAETRKRKAA